MDRKKHIKLLRQQLSNVFLMRMCNAQSFIKFKYSISANHRQIVFFRKMLFV